MIAGKEMVQAKVRFGLLIGAIALLVFLILFQQAPEFRRRHHAQGSIRVQEGQPEKASQ